MIMDNSPPSDAAYVSRAKHSRALTTGSTTLAGAVRSRTSPPLASTSDYATAEGGRPPAKRARKAINCEPCRGSKLKCDRNRPCSSCVLRGTAAACYSGAEGMAVQGVRGDENNPSRSVDPQHEFARIRHSLAVLESLIHQDQPRTPSGTPTIGSTSDYSSSLVVTESSASVSSNNLPKKESPEHDIQKRSVPGMLSQQSQGGLYAGPTSVASNLVMSDSREGDSSRLSSEDHSEGTAASSLPDHDYDGDLISDLPPLQIIDGLIDYYFEYCNWIYRHVNQPAFTNAWARFKTGVSPDRLVLSTAGVLMAIAVFYLPERHPLLANIHETHEQLGDKYYSVMVKALARYQAENKTYSLELVELLLVRCHYLTLSKTDCEEVWTVRGELVSIGMAMGLHRDPRKWKMNKELAERRRWAWWHIILLERWQAFMFGRPISIASHHFDTQLPSSHDPSLLSNTQQVSLYLPNIALLKLAFILGDIMNDAVSLKPVPYQNVLSHDAALQAWMDNLPKELDLDDFGVARSLASRDLGTIRLGVQSVIIRTAYDHIRFTLHRPYASAHATSKLQPTSSFQQQSLETAVKHARRLLQVVGQARPDFLANVSLAVPAHMNWGPFHVFSAGMFFSFQLINNPDQAGANMFRENLRYAMDTLRSAKDAPVAEKALDILQALAPLSLPDGDSDKGKEVASSRRSKEEREKRMRQVLSAVRNLAFPYHDSPAYPYPYGRGSLDSPASGGRRGSSGSPPIVSGRLSVSHALDSGPGPNPGIEQQNHPGHAGGNMSSYRSLPAELSSLAPYTHPPPMPPPHMHSSLVPQNQQQASPASAQSVSDMAYAQNYPQQHMYDMQYVQPASEEMVWGASMGFGHGEWTNFISTMRHDPGSDGRTGSGQSGHGPPPS